MTVGVGQVKVSLTPRGIPRRRLRHETLGEDMGIHGINVVHVEDHARPIFGRQWGLGLRKIHKPAADPE